MKNLIIPIIVIIPVTAAAQFHDHDGHLEIVWSQPGSGNPPESYMWSYTINGVADSVTGTSTAADTAENSVTLTTLGDWAIFKVCAVSILHDTSEWAISDTAAYNTDQGIGPPRMINWIQGP